MLAKVIDWFKNKNYDDEFDEFDDVDEFEEEFIDYFGSDDFY